MLQPPPGRSGCIWIHACSVGEVGSVIPLIQLLNKQYQVHLTVVTATGYAHARRHLSEEVSLSYLPWDLPTIFSRFVKKLSPSLLLLAETEFWPGMLKACRKEAVPVVGINTRISDRSFPRYHASRGLWKRWLKPVDLFLAQSAIDAERLIAMGIDSDKVRITGNLKYAVSAPHVDASRLRAAVDPSQKRPLLLIASTHEKEDEKILDMWPIWHAKCPELLTIIVPRHPQRFEQVADTILSRGLQMNRWSNPDHSKASDIMLVDAMGELGKLYCIADVVIIAGSLTNIGGHNPLEAAICGRGVVTGPYIQNFREIMAAMQSEQAAIIVNSDSELEQAISRLLEHPDELQSLHASASLFIQDKSGVLERMIDAIQPWLKNVERKV